MYRVTIVCQDIVLRFIVEAESTEDAHRLAVLESIAEGYIVLSAFAEPI